MKVRLNRDGIFDVIQASIVEAMEESNGKPFSMSETVTSQSLFLVEESIDPKVKSDLNPEQNIATTSETIEEVNIILVFYSRSVNVIFSG